MEFKLEKASPAGRQYGNQYGQKVVIGQNGKVYASGSMMAYQVEDVIAGANENKEVIDVRN